MRKNNLEFSGFSLIEMMVTLAIFGILSVGMASYMANMSNQQKVLMQKAMALGIDNSITDYFTNSTLASQCSQNLTNASPALTFPAAITQPTTVTIACAANDPSCSQQQQRGIYYGYVGTTPGQPLIMLGQQTDGSGLYIQSVNLVIQPPTSTPPTSGNATYYANAEIVYSNPPDMTTSQNSVPPSFETPKLSFGAQITGGTATLTGCGASVDSSDSSFLGSTGPVGVTNTETVPAYSGTYVTCAGYCDPMTDPDDCTYSYCAQTVPNPMPENCSAGGSCNQSATYSTSGPSISGTNTSGSAVLAGGTASSITLTGNQVLVVASEIMGNQPTVPQYGGTAATITGGTQACSDDGWGNTTKATVDGQEVGEISDAAPYGNANYERAYAFGGTITFIVPQGSSFSIQMNKMSCGQIEATFWAL